MIFDLVLDKPDTNAIFFTQETIDLDIKRTLNVAVTRAKFKLFIVGNFEFCLCHAKFNAFSDFLRYIQRFHREDYSTYLPAISQNRAQKLITQKQIVCNQVSFGEYFKEEIQNMHTGITIFSPYISGSRLRQLLPIFETAIQKGKKITVWTKDIKFRDMKDREIYVRYEKQLQNAGVAVRHRGNMHEKLIFVDNTIMWNGSLNALSYTGKTDEIMIRHVGLDLGRLQLK